jgi:hypothetical protein
LDLELLLASFDFDLGIPIGGISFVLGLCLAPKSTVQEKSKGREAIEFDDLDEELLDWVDWALGLPWICSAMRASTFLDFDLLVDFTTNSHSEDNWRTTLILKLGLGIQLGLGHARWDDPFDSLISCESCPTVPTPSDLPAGTTGELPELLLFGKELESTPCLDLRPGRFLPFFSPSLVFPDDQDDAAAVAPPPLLAFSLATEGGGGGGAAAAEGGPYKLGGGGHAL